MPATPRKACLGLLTLLLFCGCAQFPEAHKAFLAQPSMSARSVALEIFTARYPMADEELNGPLWTEVDEQQIPIELRRRLQGNGLRIGLIGARLPPALEHLLNLPETQPTGDQQAMVVDPLKQPSFQRRIQQIRAGQPTRLIATGEQTRHAQLAVLIKADDGQVGGRSYPQALGQITVRSFPEGDGRVKLELTPELEFGESQRHFIPQNGVISTEFGPDREVFDELRTELMLSPGQMIIVSCLPDRVGSLGYHYFTDDTSGTLRQKLLLIRLAQTPVEDLFSNDGLDESLPEETE